MVPSANAFARAVLGPLYPADGNRSDGADGGALAGPDGGDWPDGEGLRPRVPGACPPALARLLPAMWHADPEKRPAFRAILSALNE